MQITQCYEPLMLFMYMMNSFMNNTYVIFFFLAEVSFSVNIRGKSVNVDMPFIRYILHFWK